MLAVKAEFLKTIAVSPAPTFHDYEDSIRPGSFDPEESSNSKKTFNVGIGCRPFGVVP